MPTAINIWSLKYKRNLLLVLLVVTAAAGFTWIKFYSPVQPQPLSSSAHEPGAHWSFSALPFSLPLINQASFNWEKYITNATQSWQDSNVVKYHITKTAQPGLCEVNSGSMNFCSWNGDDGLLSKMMYVYTEDDPHIITAVAAVNDAYLQNPKSEYNTDAWRNYVLCQSSGWLLGVPLSTNEVKGSLHLVLSCMNVLTNHVAVSDMQLPDKGDIYELQELYGHSHRNQVSSSTVAITEANRLWKANLFGNVILTESNGAKVYEQKLQDGYVMKTLVQPILKK